VSVIVTLKDGKRYIDVYGEGAGGISMLPVTPMVDGEVTIVSSVHSVSAIAEGANRVVMSRTRSG